MINVKDLYLRRRSKTLTNCKRWRAPDNIVGQLSNNSRPFYLTNDNCIYHYNKTSMMWWIWD